MPTTAALAEHYGVSQATITRVLRLVAAEGPCGHCAEVGCLPGLKPKRRASQAGEPQSTDPLLAFPEPVLLDIRGDQADEDGPEEQERTGPAWSPGLGDGDREPDEKGRRDEPADDLGTGALERAPGRSCTTCHEEDPVKLLWVCDRAAEVVDGCHPYSQPPGRVQRRDYGGGGE